MTSEGVLLTTPVRQPPSTPPRRAAPRKEPSTPPRSAIKNTKGEVKGQKAVGSKSCLGGPRPLRCDVQRVGEASHPGLLNLIGIELMPSLKRPVRMAGAMRLPENRRFAQPPDGNCLFHTFNAVIDLNTYLKPCRDPSGFIQDKDAESAAEFAAHLLKARALSFMEGDDGLRKEADNIQKGVNPGTEVVAVLCHLLGISVELTSKELESQYYGIGPLAARIEHGTIQISKCNRPAEHYVLLQCWQPQDTAVPQPSVPPDTLLESQRKLPHAAAATLTDYSMPAVSDNSSGFNSPVSESKSGDNSGDSNCRSDIVTSEQPPGQASVPSVNASSTTVLQKPAPALQKRSFGSGAAADVSDSNSAASGFESEKSWPAEKKVKRLRVTNIVEPGAGSEIGETKEEADREVDAERAADEDVRTDVLLIAPHRYDYKTKGPIISELNFHLFMSTDVFVSWLQRDVRASQDTAQFLLNLFGHRRRRR
jgi:hypothetical protein